MVQPERHGDEGDEVVRRSAELRAYSARARAYAVALRAWTTELHAVAAETREWAGGVREMTQHQQPPPVQRVLSDGGAADPEGIP
jgi:hypothetical protein